MIWFIFHSNCYVTGNSAGMVVQKVSAPQGSFMDKLEEGILEGADGVVP